MQHLCRPALTASSSVGTAREPTSATDYVVVVAQPITGYHQDEVGEWVAELECGHNQHVRHRPPFQLRAWVLDPEGRAGRLGTPLDCPLCERAAMPDALRNVRITPTWDQDTMPSGLRRAHRIAAGTWGRIVVHDGRLRFAAATTPAIDVELGTGATQAIPPGVEHEVEPLGAVRFNVELFVVDRSRQPGEPTGRRRGPPRTPAGEGGEPACWAGLVCPGCGAIINSGEHRAGCPARRATS
jgi:tellurite methyltransferase